ncbi:MAG: anthranilate synthase component I family protein [Planctomycetota bacterium]|nr:anthranilate synthase component I family protein [Planctomycetota bacterium]
MPFLHQSSAKDAAQHGLAWLEVPADRFTPVGLFLSMRASGRRPCLLESAEGPLRLARWSLLGVNPAEHVEVFAGDPTPTFSQEISTSPPAHLPPFCGGWIGSFFYEWAAQQEPTVSVVTAGPWKGKVADFQRYPQVLALDHANQKVFCIAPCKEADFETTLLALEALANDLHHPYLEADAFTCADLTPKHSMAKEDFLTGVESLRQAISEGEIFQAVLSQRFDLDFEGDPFQLYRALRLCNPSPHMFFYESPDFILVGSSPERLVSVLDGRVENRPIAGTRARSDQPEEDDRLGAELQNDPKERAEHDMLVDLARNDLGRIARTGTVCVREHAALEKFARVQHLVSRVDCELATSFTPMDALAASFPAGTVSGAPKIRAMQLLSALEPEARGPYAGAFGYIDASGNLDMAITIRTFAIRNNKLSVQAGAGIVHASKPEREYTETMEKADALFRAVHIAASGIFSSPETR